MTTTFRLNGDELNEGFLNKLRQMFAEKEIEVVVYETQIDETERIRSNPELHSRILAAGNRVVRGEGLVNVDLDVLE